MWTIQLIDSSPLPLAAAAEALTADPTGNASIAISLAATTAAAAEATAADATATEAAAGSTAAAVQQYVEPTAAAVQSWYAQATYAHGGEGGNTRYVEPPVFPGQCVPCPMGCIQQGYRCKWHPEPPEAHIECFCNVVKRASVFSAGNKQLVAMQ
jgi:hypothetical protein